jgi:dTDP-glucose pyrophosphorylase
MPQGAAAERRGRFHWRGAFSGSSGRQFPQCFPVINIVIPMAGRGSRFANAGYNQPKPLIPVHGIPMIRLVIENIRPARDHRFVFICQNAHLREFGLANLLQEWAPGAEIIGLNEITEGAACTVLLARTFIDSADPLMIANSDQYVDADIDAYLSGQDIRGLDGLIMTMPADDPKWSFVGIDGRKLVTRVVEKEVISNIATVGIYNFTRGADYVRAADAMIAKNLRVNNEFYVAPVYNELIGEGQRIGFYDIGDTMHGLGVPDDLAAFLKLPLARRATAGLS